MDSSTGIGVTHFSRMQVPPLGQQLPSGAVAIRRIHCERKPSAAQHTARTNPRGMEQLALASLNSLEEIPFSFSEARAALSDGPSHTSSSYRLTSDR
jgi:hypothetical protein